MSSLCLWKQEGRLFVGYSEMLFLAQDRGIFFRLGVQANFFDGGFRYF